MRSLRALLGIPPRLDEFNGRQFRQPLELFESHFQCFASPFSIHISRNRHRSTGNSFKKPPQITLNFCNVSGQILRSVSLLARSGSELDNPSHCDFPCPRGTHVEQSARGRRVTVFQG